MALNPHVLAAFLEAASDTLERHALSVFPEECCAFIVSRPSGLQSDLELVLADNVAPSRVRSFVLDPHPLLARLLQGDTLEALIHSHSRGRAHFSAEDVRAALSPEGAPLYPGVAHVVLEVGAEGLRNYAAYGWRDGHFDELLRGPLGRGLRSLGGSR